MALRRSAGFAVIWDGKILLSHATNSPWHKSYSIVKGGIEDGESTLDAAIREFKEETGHEISKSIINDNSPYEPGIGLITVQNATKVLTAYMVHISDPKEIGLQTTSTSKHDTHTVYPKGDLQLEEIDWAGFVDFEEAKGRMAPYQLPILEAAIASKARVVQEPISSKSKLTFNCIDSSHGFWDIDVEGHDLISRVAPGKGIKRGDIFNVYYNPNGKYVGSADKNFSLSKTGFVWEGDSASYAYIEPEFIRDLEKSIRMHESELVENKKVPMEKTEDKSKVSTSTNLAKMKLDSSKQVPYVPISDICGANLGTVVPRGMISEMYGALNQVKSHLMREFNMDLDDYVQDRLRYSPEELGIDRKLYDKSSPEVRKKLINDKLCSENGGPFAGEQIDALALAIFNIERSSANGYGMIIGDMTGIGKGRIAAGLIRYCIKYHDKVPIFITEKSYLFSDIYRDLKDIKSDSMIPLYLRAKELDYEKPIKMTQSELKEIVKDRLEMGDSEDEALEYAEEIKTKGYKTVLGYRLNRDYHKQLDGISKNVLQIVPFILNDKKPESKIQDDKGNIIYEPPTANADFKKIISNKKLTKDYNLVMLTYSQINTGSVTPKKAFLNEIAPGTIIICDESHTASGESNTGLYIFDLLSKALGAAFLSATYSKRPNNMVVYASKTSLREAELSKEDLISAITRGGVALQEIISSQLVSEGQMVRRMRTYEGVDILWNTLDKSMADDGHPEFDLKDKHTAISNMFTEILRDVIELQNEKIKPWLKNLTKKDIEAFLDQVMPGEKIDFEGSDVKKMLTSSPIFSRVFNLINQLLFSIKSEAIAERAISYMKQGKKPVIAFSNTMGAFLESMTNEDGEPLSPGDEISTDFRLVLQKLLQTTLTINLKSPQGKGNRKIRLNKSNLPKEIRDFFNLVESKIKRISIGISISPIDVLLYKIKQAGFTVEEVTGRKSSVRFVDDTFMKGIYEYRQKPTTSDTFRGFNENIYDCVLINQSGAVGASFHASPNNVVNHVKFKKSDGTIVSTPFMKGMKETLIIPNSLEPKNEIKQRVMIMLQSELNINTEVQKRGRIFRSGQVLPPMYEYLCSAIPAEQRLQMMMQKKLRSLDASTSSDQKSSDELVNITDFLNPYGDVICLKYLMEHKELVKKLGDPFGMVDEKTGQIRMPAQIPDNAAHKLSGRMAVMSVSDQADFYTEVSQKYSEYISFLDDTEQYTGEVKYLDLQAENIERQIFQVGSGGKSLFGKNTIMELSEVNNLRKPYTKEDLDMYLIEAIQEFLPENFEEEEDSDKKFKEIRIAARKQQQQLLKEYNTYHAERVKGLDEFYEEKRTRALSRLEDKQYKKLLKENPEEAKRLMASYIQKTNDNIDEEKALDEVKIANSFQTVTNYLGKLRTGVVTKYVSGLLHTKAIVISVQKGGKSSPNPFAPSAITIRLAVANGIRNISFSLSNVDFLNSIIAEQITDINEESNVFETWDEITKESMADRNKRYIITGNILQAMSDAVVAENTGQLIKFTENRNGKVVVRNGILLSAEFNPLKHTGGRGSSFVLVPANKCLPVVKRLERKRSESDDMQSIYETNNQIQFMRAGNGYDYLMRVPKEPQWKHIYADTKLLPFLNDEKGFTDWGYVKVWNASTLKREDLKAMGATVKEEKMQELLDYISSEYRSSFKIASAVFNEIKSTLDINTEDDYNDGQEIEESESGLSQAVLTNYDKKLAEQEVEEQTSGLMQPHIEEPAPPKVEPAPTELIDQALDQEAAIAQERASFDYERKLFKLQKLLLSGKMATGGELDRKWQMSDFTTPGAHRYERFSVKPVSGFYGIYDRENQKFVTSVKAKGIRKQPPYLLEEDADKASSQMNYEHNQHLDFIWNHEHGGELIN